MSGVVFWLGPLIVVGLLPALGRALFFLVHVDGRSMSPALEDGDRVLALRYWPARWLRRGQIVVWSLPPGPLPVPGLRADGQIFIKRIAGLPGDTVILPALDSRWSVGLEPREHYGLDLSAWAIPRGHCFLKGDSLGLDSTSLGPVPLRSIRGVVLARLWRGATRHARAYPRAGASWRGDKSTKP